MAAHNDLGRRGEEIAVAYLLTRGYKVLETNFRFSRAEVDIIAWKGGLLVFIEVKSRSSLVYGLPEIFITKRKVELMMDAAYHYMEKKSHNWEIRFDVISLILAANASPRIKHIEDAFVP